MRLNVKGLAVALALDCGGGAEMADNGVAELPV